MNAYQPDPWELEEMIRYATLENAAMKRRDKGFPLPYEKMATSKIHIGEKIIRRAKVLCASCDTYLKPDEFPKYRGSNCCQSDACKAAIDRWTHFKK